MNETVSKIPPSLWAYRQKCQEEIESFREMFPILFPDDDETETLLVHPGLVPDLSEPFGRYISLIYQDRIVSPALKGSPYAITGVRMELVREPLEEIMFRYKGHGQFLLTAQEGMQYCQRFPARVPREGLLVLAGSVYKGTLREPVSVPVLKRRAQRTELTLISVKESGPKFVFVGTRRKFIGGDHP